MAEKQDAHIEAIGKLIKLTQRGELKWHAVDIDTLEVAEGRPVGPAFETTYNLTRLRIFAHKYKTENISFAFASMLARSSGNAPSKYVSVTKTVLEIVNDEGIGVWQFPKEQILDDLMSAIKYKYSGAQDLITNLLKE